MYFPVACVLSEQVPSGVQIVREAKWQKVKTYRIYLMQDTPSLKWVKALKELSAETASEVREKEMWGRTSKLSDTIGKTIPQ